MRLELRSIGLLSVCVGWFSFDWGVAVSVVIGNCELRLAVVS